MTLSLPRLRNLGIGWLLVNMLVLGISAISSGQVKPNIVLINLDDADYEMLNLDFTQDDRVYFPNIKKLAESGIRFSNAHVTTPLCGPSRACLMRGQYAHNSGVLSNDPNSDRSLGFPGGYKRYKQLGNHQNDLSTWMRDAGYQTLFVGKYLHPGLGREVPPGWNEFYSYNGALYYDSHRIVNGQASNAQGKVYRTLRETKDCLDLIQAQIPGRRQKGTPFFLYYAPYAPHLPKDADVNSMTQKKYERIWANEIVPRDADFDESNVLDKPNQLQQVARMNDFQLALQDTRYKDRLRAMKTIDDTIGKIVKRLQVVGELAKTYIILTSDNGYLLGHHRVNGKQFNYDRVTRVPLIVSGPGVAKNAMANHLIGHIDIAPTITDLAGGTIPEFVDGKSFASLLPNPNLSEAKEWRDCLLIENWQYRTMGRGFRRYRLNVNYVGLRLFDESYTRWPATRAEFYRLGSDPTQEFNTYDSLNEEKKESLNSMVESIRNSPESPAVTISNPFWETWAPDDGISGYAESSSTIKLVNLKIRNLTQNRFWNGTSWQNKSIEVPAEIRRKSQKIVVWDYKIPPEKMRNNDLLIITSRAQNSDGKWTIAPAPQKTFTVDSQLPKTTISSPLEGTEISGKVTVSGTAEDNLRVDRVRLVIENLSNGLYWGAKGWQTEEAKNPTQLSESATNPSWTFEFRPPQKANIKISARAFDEAGNFDDSASIVTIEFK